MQLPQGTLLQGGKYRIERVLGQGGFGITYLAEQVRLRRQVAVKEFFMKDFNVRDGSTGTVSTPSTGSTKQVEQYRNKFVKEASNLAALNHPHISQVIDIFDENGTVYYVMPYYPGGSLSDLVKAHGPLGEQEAMKMIRPIADALRYMHSEKRLCHYDVKPANILLDDKGAPVLIDFGISKNYDAGGNETSSTPIGMSEGYAPIEQYQGQVQEFSPESDVYALGATLYYLLTGKKPPTAIDRVGGAELDFPAACSPAVRQLVESSMTIARQKRPKTTGVFLQDIPHAPQAPADQPESDDDVTVVQGYQHVPRPTSQQILRDAEFNVNGVSFKMIAVEGGMFMMGATNEQDCDAFDNEKPAHKVTLSSFFIGETEVTQALWVAVMGSNPSRFKGDDLPVDMVSWNHCQVFIKKLNAITGKRFRLPTEAEWEFAARGGNASQGCKYSGSDYIDDVAWYDDNSGNLLGFKRKFHPVGTKSPNELGLYDMSGNVWEWCQDWYGEYSSAAQTNPTGPASGSFRVSRGGAFHSEAEICRVSNRFNSSVALSDYSCGFRLAL